MGTATSPMAFGLVKFRPAEDADVPFISTHWTRAQESRELREPGPTLSRGCGPTYAAVQRRIVDRLRARKGVEWRVACTAMDPSYLLGFSCVSPASSSAPRHLHFVYVRPEDRAQGIARELLGPEELGSCSVHWKGLAYRPEASW
jgi:GNAT superfamily N-acetyltransferase